MKQLKSLVWPFNSADLKREQGMIKSTCINYILLKTFIKNKEKKKESKNVQKQWNCKMKRNTHGKKLNTCTIEKILHTHYEANFLNIFNWIESDVSNIKEHATAMFPDV